MQYEESEKGYRYCGGRYSVYCNMAFSWPKLGKYSDGVLKDYFTDRCILQFDRGSCVSLLQEGYNTVNSVKTNSGVLQKMR